MYYVYVLENPKGKHYIGHSSDVGLRKRRHNTHRVFSTKNRGPWRVIYTREFETHGEAMRWEKYLKRQKGGNGLKKIIENTDDQ